MDILSISLPSIASGISGISLIQKKLKGPLVLTKHILCLSLIGFSSPIHSSYIEAAGRKLLADQVGSCLLEMS